MKKTILITVLALTVMYTTQAQLVKFGIKGGLNFANFTGGSGSDFDFKTITSYHGGFLAELKIFENFAIQPELLYATQGAELNNLGDQIINEMGYLTMPVLAKIYLTKNELSLELGPQAAVLVSERNKVASNDSNTFDLGIAGGLSYKITKSIFISGRYTAGLTEAKQDSKLKNSVIQFSAGLLF